jgi:sugar lactone lactonase YvrE
MLSNFRAYSIASLIVLAIGLVIALLVQAASSGRVATKAFGQLDLVHNGVNIVSNVGLWNPQAVAIDHSFTPNRLYIADAGNHRVLGWHSVEALENGSSADLVIGQVDFLSWQAQCNNAGVTGSTLCVVSAIAVDGAGNLYVVDNGNNRVLEYNSPFSTDTQPDLVFGQRGSFTSSACNNGGVSAESLCAPNGVAVDSSGRFYISDTANSRVLEYNSPLRTGGARADMVFGQYGSFNAASCNAGGVSADSLCHPTAIAVDNADNLYIGDHDNYRVLEYDTPPSLSNTSANLVFGQNNSFTSNTNTCAVSASAAGLCTPGGITTDAAGNLYIAGSSFSRVLEYNTPVATANTMPDAVFGQPDFTSGTCNNGGLGAGVLCAPIGLATDDVDRLFVADFANNRVVAYQMTVPKVSAVAAADLVLGQMVLNQNGVNITKPDGLYWPVAVVLDTYSTPNHIYLVDTGNSRVLGWYSVPTFKYAGPPDLVIGQSDSSAAGCNQNRVDAANNLIVAADTLCEPGGAAVDPAGNLYVADSGNFRVLEYNTPFDSGTSADLSANLVLGQHGSFTSRVENNGGVSAASMSQPGGIADDEAGHLYVSDPSNNRVLEYDNPARNTNAEAVFGQGGDFTASTCNFDGSCDRTGCFASADALCGPAAVSVDPAGKLYIADTINNRVLIFDAPIAPAKTANIVIGQPNFERITCGSLCAPAGLALDSAGDLFAADSTNSIVDQYNAPLRNGMLPQTAIGHAQCNQSSATDNSLCGPSGLAVDPAGFLYVSDTFDNRALAFALVATPIPTATFVATPTPTPTAERPTATASPTPMPGHPSISSIPDVILVGSVFTIQGRGFTPGSRINFFVATASEPINTGPFTPLGFAPGLLTVAVPASNPLGQGVVSVQVVNTDQGFVSSNAVSALLQGDPAAGIQSITGINSVPLAANSTSPDIAVANVETVVVQGQQVTIEGTGFDTVHGVAVDLFCSCPGDKVGPFFLNPGEPGLTATRIAFTVAVSGLDSPATGPGSFVVSNKGNDGSFSRKSNAVSVPIGQRITVTSVNQTGGTVTVNGTGFSSLTVINFFNMPGAAVVNLGGLMPDGKPNIPLTLINVGELTFSLPADATAGPGYILALSPPFVPFTSSGGGPGGSFTVK